MLRGKLLLAFIALWSVSFQQGCQDLTQSLTHLSYYPIRDMRQTVVLDPQRGDPMNPKWRPFRGPDSLAVPSIGRDLYVGEAPYDAMADALQSPFASDDASIVRGDSLFHQTCWTCHGKTLIGDGPSAALFMPPPDLLAQATRERSDGFIFSYVRHGGVVMPSFGNAMSAHDTWDLVHYIRHQQKVSPR
ncbi:MAG: c-type cytochrome [Candidatus Eisenbacteria bacterium]|nr:c-type cytochrome [Candidatus Eisenbacteria bacterium]